MTIRFPGDCVVCGEKVNANETGMWARGVGVRHVGCVQAKTLACIVCGGPAGCGMCEFRDDCDIESVSDICICRKCSEMPDTFSVYQRAAAKRFPLLNPDPF